MTDDMVTVGRQVPGRDEAIAALFSACYPQLVATGYAVAGDWAVAEELAQEAFMRLWRRWRWLRDPDAAPAYLHRTVVNLGNSAIRRRVLERRLAATGGQSAEAGPEVGIELRQAIAALSPRKRACVVLRYLADMTEAQAAQTLGITPGTVKSQTHKALRQLRQQLADPAEAADQAHSVEAGQ